MGGVLSNNEECDPCPEFDDDNCPLSEPQKECPKMECPKMECPMGPDCEEYAKLCVTEYRKLREEKYWDDHQLWRLINNLRYVRDQYDRVKDLVYTDENGYQVRGHQIFNGNNNRADIVFVSNLKQYDNFKQPSGPETYKEWEKSAFNKKYVTQRHVEADRNEYMVGRRLRGLQVY